VYRHRCKLLTFQTGQSLAIESTNSSPMKFTHTVMRSSLKSKKSEDATVEKNHQSKMSRDRTHRTKLIVALQQKRFSRRKICKMRSLNHLRPQKPEPETGTSDGNKKKQSVPSSKWIEIKPSATTTTARFIRGRRSKLILVRRLHTSDCATVGPG